VAKKILGNDVAAKQELLDGIERTGEPFTITFRSKTIEATTGQSVLAALMAAGERMCRTTAARAERGAFCGMGVCQDCLVRIDGLGLQRACMTPVRAGMTINALGPQEEAWVADSAPGTTQETPDVLVVGGGPAGLAAAAVAAEAGLDVLLVDERGKLGGQFYKQPADGFEVDESRIDKQFRDGRALIRRVVASGARYLSGVTVWGAFGAEEFVASGPAATVVIRPKRIVLATGAYERGVPLPGWTLPGFITTGAAQTLLRSYQTVPGKRVLLAGNGPLNLQVAAELTRAGVKVVALVEAAQRPGLQSIASLAVMAANAPRLIADARSYQATLRRAGTPTYHRHAVIRVEGAASVERATIAEIDDGGSPVRGAEKTFDVDVVCVGFGFLPSNEIARGLGCRHQYDERRGHLTAQRDENGRSSIANVWIVGDSGGLNGAPSAKASGIVAGADVARDLGRDVPNKVEVETAKRAIRLAAAFQSALWTLFRAPKIVDQLAELDTILCRCEEISVATVRQEVAEGIATAGAVKRVTRAGMGRCQGRYCGSLVVDLVARQNGTRVDEFSYFAPRVPFRPVSVSTISDIGI
jgi:NADPH-dependent 2,4-dienoyl-CoA reductase/sulfur reductase-like enzyme